MRFASNRMTLRAFLVLALCACTVASARVASAQTRSKVAPLQSRTDLANVADREEMLAATGNAEQRTRSSMIAASIRKRLREGDFQSGDRLVLSYMTDTLHTDTLMVHGNRTVELPGKIVVQLTGVLRSEAEDRISTELSKYVRAEQIEVTPLMRVGVLGDVAHPGFFAFASDILLTDAIMGAGGPTATADLDRSVVRRGMTVLHSAEETRTAIAQGLTLDQFGINAGDELVIGQRPESRSGTVLAMIGGVASVVTLFVALRR